MDFVVELHSETALDDKHALARVLDMKPWSWLVRGEGALVSGNDALQSEIARRIQLSGKSFITTAVIRGRTVLRFASRQLSSVRTLRSLLAKASGWPA